MGFGPQSFSAAGLLSQKGISPELKEESLTVVQFSSRLKTEMYYAASMHQRRCHNIVLLDCIKHKYCYCLPFDSNEL